MSAASASQFHLRLPGDDVRIRPFAVHVPQSQLTDLRRRIAATRWPSRELVTDASQGVQLATVRELARTWQMDYDWGKFETRLNAFPQFMTTIDGVDIHFIHVRSKHPNGGTSRRGPASRGGPRQAGCWIIEDDEEPDASCGAIAAQMDLEGAQFIERLKSPEAREAFAAFAQKRFPDFSRIAG